MASITSTPETSVLVKAAHDLLLSMDLAPAAMEARKVQIAEEVGRTGTYTLTHDELVHGARLAWYNSNRCIARHLWRTLHVFDERGLTGADQVTDALRRHVAFAYNGGAIRSAITVFAPRPVQGPDVVRLENRQLVQFAAFMDEQGKLLGDGPNAAFTRRCLDAGWTPTARGPFVSLPWMLHVSGHAVPPIDVFAQEPGLAPLVRIEHPENPAIAELGLHWYPVPLLADMALVIGGIVFPCAPFNGFYMVTEIASRDLVDKDRYDALPAVGRCFGLDTSTERSLWRDRAVVELNRAVLHSFDRDGVRISDHHTMTAAFERFCAAEQRSGRTVTGDWSWLVPPTSGALAPQYHRTFDEAVVRHTNYLYQPPLLPPAQGEALKRCPYHL